jgi:hypothetical protein
MELRPFIQMNIVHIIMLAVAIWAVFQQKNNIASIARVFNRPKNANESSPIRGLLVLGFLGYFILRIIPFAMDLPNAISSNGIEISAKIISGDGTEAKIKKIRTYTVKDISNGKVMELRIYSKKIKTGTEKRIIYLKNTKYAYLPS